MSQHEPDTDDAEEQREIDLADPDDYHRRQRLKEIHKARQRVHKVIDDFEKANRLKKGNEQRRKLAFAVSMYVSELETIITDTDADVSLPEHYPYDDVLAYADSLGRIPADFDRPDSWPEKMKHTPQPNSVQVFRVCNKVLADVKPLITDDDADEWEV
jgi:hypothetical protein